MQKKNNDTSIKRMAELLRRGATLTDLSCPACSSPLFRLEDGTLWCAKDEKKVIIVKEGEEPPQVSGPTVMQTLETTLMAKVQNIQAKIQHTENVTELSKLSKTLSELLDNLDKIRRMKKS